MTQREELERYLVYAVFNLKIDRKDFAKRFGIDVMDVVGDKIKRLIADRLVAETEDEFLITEKGFLYIFNISKFFFSQKYQLLTELL